MERSNEEDPVSLQPDGNIKLKPEKMEVDRLYHCVADDKVYLFYKDENELLNCYEINDEKVVKEIISRPADLEEILKSYSEH